MAAVSRNSVENQQIQELLEKRAARKQKISKVVPYAGLAFVLIFLHWLRADVL